MRRSRIVAKPQRGTFAHAVYQLEGEVTGRNEIVTLGNRCSKTVYSLHTHIRRGSTVVRSISRDVSQGKQNIRLIIACHTGEVVQTGPQSAKNCHEISSSRILSAYRRSTLALSQEVLQKFLTGRGSRLDFQPGLVQAAATPLSDSPRVFGGTGWLPPWRSTSIEDRSRTTAEEWICETRDSTTPSVKPISFIVSSS